MKKLLFLEIMGKMLKNPKSKIFLLIGIIGIIITGAFVIWLGTSAIKYVASSADQIITFPVTQVHVEHFKSELQKLPEFNALSCWEYSQKLLTIHAWLVNPFMDNLINLKFACLGKPTQFCQEKNCVPINSQQDINITQGSVI